MNKRIAIILLAYGRDELTESVLTHNLKNCGIDSKFFDVYRIHQKGIALALNRGIIDAKKKFDYDYFMFMANDIYEPDGWLLSRVYFSNIVPNAGLISVSPDHTPSGIEMSDVIGNMLVPKNVIDKIGYFNEELGEYAPVDNDYNCRVHLAGFSSFYIPLLQSRHEGADDEAYGYSKQERIKQIWPEHVKDVNNYIAKKKSIYYKSKLL